MVNMKFSLKRLIYNLTLISIAFLPKINLISIPGVNTGIRIDDFLIGLSIIIYLISRKQNIDKTNNPHIQQIILYMILYFALCVVSTICYFIFRIYLLYS